MIVSCEKCTKKFNIHEELIPENGRLLQCGSCNHKWFYKITAQNISLEDEDKKNIFNEQPITEEKKKIIEKIIKTSVPSEKKEIKKKEKEINIKANKNIKKSSNLLKNLIVLIISIIALIILVDTFKFQIEKYFPGVNLVLNNLYETLKDIFLFAKDLIN